jgi:bifunctional non-homologous end joining protein LigD
MRSVAFKRSAPKRHSSVPGARSRPYPGFIAFCDPTLREQASPGRQWVHEIKTDGYQAQVHIRDGKVIVYSRSGYDWTRQFAAIAKAASRLKVRDAILDGEATVLGASGYRIFRPCGGSWARPSQAA